MKSLEEFRVFCQRDLQDTLKELEKRRKSINNKYAYAVPMLIVPIAGVIIFKHIAFLVVPAIIIALYLWLVPYRAYNSFHKLFKERLIKQIIRFINDELVYRPNCCIKEQTFNFANIFRSYTEYEGDDYVSGKIGKTTVEFSELTVEKQISSGKGNRKVIVFKGLFLIADFHKNFKGETYVLKDEAESFLGILGSKLQSMNFSRPPLVKVEDTEFEKNFVVYASDQVEARYILSPSFMDRVLQLKAKTKSDIQMSFRKSKIFLAIPTHKEFLKPSLGNSFLAAENLEEYFTDINQVLEVVEDLSLNTRIWSKA